MSKKLLAYNGLLEANRLVNANTLISYVEKHDIHKLILSIVNINVLKRMPKQITDLTLSISTPGMFNGNIINYIIDSNVTKLGIMFYNYHCRVKTYISARNNRHSRARMYRELQILMRGITKSRIHTLDFTSMVTTELPAIPRNVHTLGLVYCHIGSDIVGHIDTLDINLSAGKSIGLGRIIKRVKRLYIRGHVSYPAITDELTRLIKSSDSIRCVHCMFTNYDILDVLRDKINITAVYNSVGCNIHRRSTNANTMSLNAELYKYQHAMDVFRLILRYRGLRMSKFIIKHIFGYILPAYLEFANCRIITTGNF